MQTLHNGKPAQSLPFEDRGWALGDALFETLLVRQGRAVWLDEHLQRLQLGCAQIQLDFPEKALRTEIDALLKSHPSERAVLRLCLSRDSLGLRGYAAATRTPHRYCQIVPVPEPVREYWEQGVCAFVAQTRLPEQAQLAGIKHTNRLPHVLARAERPHSDFPEGLMLSVSGLVIEGIASNCFIAKNEVLFTPLLDQAGVAGIARKKVIQSAQVAGVPVIERRLTMADITAADELFFCSSLIGLWPVRQLDCLSYSSFKLCQRVQKDLESVWYG